jgi:hypothetical protein
MNQQRRLMASTLLLSRQYPKSMRQLSRNPCHFSTTQEEPFYGRPRGEQGEPFYGRPRESIAGPSRSIQDRIAIALHAAVTALNDPTRADAVAALGDITSPVTLQRLHDQMKNDPTGRLILKDRPVVSKATIPYEKLIAEAPDNPHDTPGITFGQAYGAFLKSHGFDPDERDDVKYIDDENLAYVMTRYRQVRCRGGRKRMLGCRNKGRFSFLPLPFAPTESVTTFGML